MYQRCPYAEVYSTHENLHDLQKDQIAEKFKIVTGLGSDNKVLSNIIGSYVALIDLADFTSASIVEKPLEPDTDADTDNEQESTIMKKLGFSYTINLNLPATTDPRVYNAIFKSLKENLFK